MSTRRSAAFGVGLALAGVLAGNARADVMIPGGTGRHRPVLPTRVDVRVDAGWFKDRIAVPYHVEKGDSLESVAKGRLGDRKFVPVLRALNPEVDGDALAVGQVLRLPPKKLAESEPLEKLAGRVLTLWTTRASAGTLVPVEPDAPLAGIRWVCLFAVPGDRLAAHVDADHRIAIDWDAATKDVAIARSPLLDEGATDAEEGALITVTLTITAIDGKSITVTANRTVKKGALGGIASPSRFLSGAAAGLALVLLLVVAVLRRRAPVPAVA